MNKRKILIPLDGSDFSRQIVRVVQDFFDPDDVSLILFRAAYPPAAADESAHPAGLVEVSPLAASYETYRQALDTQVAALTDEYERYRQELLAELRRDADLLRQEGYSVSVQVQFGEPAQRIIDFVGQEGVDLVAMATHGRSGLGRLVLGSVAERVVRSVPVPVLLMRPTEGTAPQLTPGEELARRLGQGGHLQLLAATDGTPLAQRAVQVAVELAQTLDAHLRVLVVGSERDGVSHNQKIMADTAGLLAPLQPRAETIPLVGFADEEVLHYLDQNPGDLLVIGPFRDRGAGPATAIGHTAQRLVQHAPTSVLMVKNPPTRFRRILACAAVDDRAVVDVAAGLAQVLGSALTVLHVVPPSAATYLAPEDDHGHSGHISLESVLSQNTHLSELVQRWLATLERHGMGRDVRLVKRSSVPEAILKVAHDEDFDLLVVGSQSSAGHFLDTVANAVVRYAERSVLVVRTRPR